MRTFSARDSSLIVTGREEIKIITRMTGHESMEFKRYHDLQAKDG
jgi:hypothetical protein